jgi:hypothetical protein
LRIIALFSYLYFIAYGGAETEISVITELRTCKKHYQIFKTKVWLKTYIHIYLIRYHNQKHNTYLQASIFCLFIYLLYIHVNHQRASTSKSLNRTSLSLCTKTEYLIYIFVCHLTSKVILWYLINYAEDLVRKGLRGEKLHEFDWTYSFWYSKKR